MRLKQALDGYAISCIADGFSPLTIAAYKNALGILAEFLGNPDVQSITEADLKRFTAHLRTAQNAHAQSGKLSTASLHRYWKAIRSFYKWAAAELGTGRPDACLIMPRYNHKEIVPFTQEEIQRILKACETARPAAPEGRKAYTCARPTAERDKALIMFLLDTGLRVGELTRLKIGDVEPVSGQVCVQPHHIGKTRPRTVLIGKTTRKILWHYISSRDNQDLDQPLFVTMGGEDLTRYSVEALLDRIGKRAGVAGVHPHRFRHTFAITYLRNGGDVFTLQSLLGHSGLDMVRHYLRLAQTDVTEAHRRASPVDRWKL